MWYSPWIKVFVKQWLAEKVNFEEKKFKRLQYLLYFVVAQDYSEYEYLKNFFDETKNNYQKWNIKNKFFSTLSIIVLAILWYFWLKIYTQSPIYTTNLFIIIFTSAFILWYFKKFRLANSINFDLFSKYKKEILWWVWIVLILFIFLFYLGFISLKLIIDIFNNHVILLILIVGIISSIVAIFAKKYKWINSWLYKIITFTFLVMFFAGFSNQSVQKDILNSTKSAITKSIWVNENLVTFLIPNKIEKQKNNNINSNKAMVKNSWTWNIQNVVKSDNKNINNLQSNILQEPKK